MCHKVLARESQEILIWQDIFTRVKGGGGGGVGGGGGEWGGGGPVDERYVALGGVYRPALRSVTRGWGGGGGVSSFPEKSVT